MRERVAAVGEELTEAWAPGEMGKLLTRSGFTDVDELLPTGSGAHVVRGRRPSPAARPR